MVVAVMVDGDVVTVVADTAGIDVDELGADELGVDGGVTVVVVVGA